MKKAALKAIMRAAFLRGIEFFHLSITANTISTLIFKIFRVIIFKTKPYKDCAENAQPLSGDALMRQYMILP